MLAAIGLLPSSWCKKIRPSRDECNTRPSGNTASEMGSPGSSLSTTFSKVPPLGSTGGGGGSVGVPSIPGSMPTGTAPGSSVGDGVTSPGVLTAMLPAIPAMPGGSPFVVGGLLVAPPAGVDGIELGLPSPSPHARVIQGTAKHETTNQRLPNILIHLLYHGPSAERSHRVACMPQRIAWVCDDRLAAPLARRGR
jgi:hypothetical protein